MEHPTSASQALANRSVLKSSCGSDHGDTGPAASLEHPCSYPLGDKHLQPHLLGTAAAVDASITASLNSFDPKHDITQQRQQVSRFQLLKLRLQQQVPALPTAAGLCTAAHAAKETLQTKWTNLLQQVTALPAATGAAKDNLQSQVMDLLQQTAPLAASFAAQAEVATASVVAASKNLANLATQHASSLAAQAEEATWQSVIAATTNLASQVAQQTGAFFRSMLGFKTLPEHSLLVSTAEEEGAVSTAEATETVSTAEEGAMVSTFTPRAPPVCDFITCDSCIEEAHLPAAGHCTPWAPSEMSRVKLQRAVNAVAAWQAASRSRYAAPQPQRHILLRLAVKAAEGWQAVIGECQRLLLLCLFAVPDIPASQMQSSTASHDSSLSRFCVHALLLHET
jgi:hypothetical protein